MQLTSYPYYINRHATTMEIDGVVYPEWEEYHTFETEGLHTVVFNVDPAVKIKDCPELFVNCSNLIEAEVNFECDMAYRYSWDEGAYRMFNSCSNLEKVTLPESFTDIGGSMFGECNKLHTLIIKAMKAPRDEGSMMDKNFGDPEKDRILYVPVGTTGYDSWGIFNNGWIKVETEF